jgi:hypothetical protein
VEPFASVIKFNSQQWYYIDIEGTQHGPVLSKLLVHKLKEGDIDGLTLVYGGDTTEWMKIADVQVLKVNSAIRLCTAVLNMETHIGRDGEDSSRRGKDAHCLPEKC